MSSLPILVKYIIVGIISMVPIVELRGAIPIAEGLGLNIFLYYPIAIIGNMLPVPFIYLFARQTLVYKHLFTSQTSPSLSSHYPFHFPI